MTEFERLVKSKIDLIRSSPKMMADAAVKAQMELWEKILVKADSIEVVGGRISQSKANIKIIEEISQLAKGSLNSLEYQQALVEFVKDINQSARISNTLAQIIKPSFDVSEFQKEFLEVAKRNAVDTLFGETITGTIISELRDALTASIASGSTRIGLIKALKPIVVGDKKTDGRLLGRVRLYAGTTQSVVDRSYTNLISTAVNAEWFIWRGSEIKTSRPFCKHRHDEYFHRKEIEAWGNYQDPTGIGGFSKDGNGWDGMISNTNQYTIFSLAGGWNCRHSIIPASISVVPRYVIDRAIAAGFYKE